MISAFAYTNVPIMPIRIEPAHRAEQVNQLLFGEKIEILDTNNKEWTKIKNPADGYIGWCKQAQITEITKKEFLKTTKYMVASNTSKIIFGNAEVWLPLGSELATYKQGKVLMSNEKGTFKGLKTTAQERKMDEESLKIACLQYLYAPYQWGGRSMAGIDCSGFTQMVYKLCNYQLPRDAYQQAQIGELVGFLQNSQLGDLAFFDDKDGKIIHVGILLDPQTIIHASDSAGRVAIDKIDQGGIISLSLRRRTHNLRIVKRVAVV